ncbi:MAG: PepSY domain-containing protein [Moraxellaceae bacterium]|nr:PepSY domain-containing protein [Moraxellaceae bacterium]
MRLILQSVSRLVLRYHRWVGLLAVLPVVLWGLSGLSHPIMSRLQPQPAAMMPPVGLSSGFDAEEMATVRPLSALSALLPGQGIHAVRQARLLRWQGRMVWQLTLPGQAERIYVDAESGMVVPDADKALAVTLARHFAGEPDRVITSMELITRFSDDYPYVNRLLPVWRVVFAGDDGLSAYVETSPLRLATLNNSLKSGFGRVFRALHSWSFINNEAVRDTVMTIFLSLAFFSSLGGLWLYGFFWRKPESGERAAPLRRWHRRLGVLVAVSTLAFTGSAILHVQLLDKGNNESVPRLLPDQLLNADSLNWVPHTIGLAANEQLDIVPVAGQVVVRASAQSASMVGRKGNGAMPAPQAATEHVHHHDGSKPAASGERYFAAGSDAIQVDGAQQHARTLAAAFAGLPEAQIDGTELVTRFAGEYGFINKRLPVWKVDFKTPDNLTLYVETTSGVQAAEVRDMQRFEGFSFAYLHKWNFLDGIGKDGRDVLLCVFALLNVVVVVLGAWLWLRRRKTPASA